MDSDRFLLGGVRHWEGWGLMWLVGVVGGGSHTSRSFRIFVFPDKMEVSHFIRVPPLDSDLQTQCYQNLWVLVEVARRRRHRGSSCLGLFAFFSLMAKKRRVLGEALIGMRGCLWMTSWRCRGVPLHMRRRENFSAAKNT